MESELRRTLETVGNNLKYARLSEFGRDLASRQRARKIREQIVHEVGADNVRLTFDFSDVRTLSDSFSDELFAVWVQMYGIEWFKKSVILTNLSLEMKQSIVSVIQNRLESKAT